VSSTNLRHSGARAPFSHGGPARPVRWHALGLVIPVLLASPRLGDGTDDAREWDGGRAAGFDSTPPPHAVNVWLDDSHGLDVDVASLKQASRAALARSSVLHPETPVARIVGGFTQVGSVAILEGDDATVQRIQTGFGLDDRNLKIVAARFIQAFGDDYDQIAVFLGFYDRISPAALAYQQPVKNDILGIGLGLFDATKLYGSESGRMQTVLNMKRINVYGRDAAGDPDNGLYPVWAQEAAHRWLVYFRLKRATDADHNELLLGRQKVHWSRGVAAEGSILDGYSWTDNGDGTFTPGARGVRYGTLDQYGMGLRAAKDVPPFFLLEEITDVNGVPIPATGGLNRSGRYRGRKVDLTVDDLIRAQGPRVPPTDKAAEDLRMGVMLLGAPGVPVGDLIGEASAINNSRQLWTDFYNEAGGGRGKVCTELYRPCRGGSFEFSDVLITEAIPGDGVITPGEAASIEVKVTNHGDVPAPAKLRLEAGEAVRIVGDPPATAPIAPGQTITVKLAANVTRAAPCGQAVTLDLRSDGAKGPSRGLVDAVFGLAPQQVEGFEDAGGAGWRVNPDGTDTGQAGRWAIGEPQRSVAFGYTLQPGAAYAGTRAFATGLTADETDNVDGRTTLESTPFMVAGVREPVLSFRAYFVAAAFGQEVLIPAAGATLQVQASLDGQPWVSVDQLVGMATGWERRLVNLTGKMGAALATATSVRFRFVVEEPSTSRAVVEMALDDVGVYGTVAACEGAGQPLPPDPVPPPARDGGGGCSAGAAARQASHPAGMVAPLVLLGVLSALGRCRRLRRRRPGDLR
jgi:hypothetical protein